VVGRGEYESIIHIAARAGVRPSVQNPQAYIDTNVNGTYNLLEAARHGKVGQFLLASSSSVYGLARKVPFSEDLPIPQTLSPYAATKLAAEHLCGNYSYLYDLPVVVLRFFTVYGPAQRPDLAIHKFTDCIYHGKPIQQYGDGTTRRDYTYVDDIVQGVIGALKYRRTPFEIFNLGENQTTTLSDLIAAIENALGKKAIIERLPEQQGDMPLTCADIDKARALLDYHPRVKISEGIPKFIDWYLKQRNR
jgi:UDP-glucuronate 4-epimerase